MCSRPENLHVSRDRDNVHLSWSTPKYRSGPINEYKIYYRIIDDNSTDVSMAYK